MALLLTPRGKNSATVECTSCPASLHVTGVQPLRLRLLVQRVETVHSCAS